MNISQNTQLIKHEATRLGFTYCGISGVRKLDKDAEHIENWIRKGMHGKMKYMGNHFEKRINPGILVEKSKSVISLLYNYFTEKKQYSPDVPKISKYAFGKDYHTVVKEKIDTLFTFIKKEIGDVNGKSFVGSGPVLEKVWAHQSGAGWIGKNTLLITKNQGSYFFLGELILDLPLTEDYPHENLCGSCTICMEACPTNALATPFKLDAKKCISYFTIELKNTLPDDIPSGIHSWIFGCDICQDVCPWNKHAKEHSETEFRPSAELLSFTIDDWLTISEGDFNQIFGRSALGRAGLKKIKQNINLLKDNNLLKN